MKDRPGRRLASLERPECRGVANGRNLPSQIVAYRERLAGTCNSSPVASDGRIYVSNNDGRTFVVKAGKAFVVLGKNEMGERITASPAISGNELIYRTDSRLYCIGQGKAR